MAELPNTQYTGETRWMHVAMFQTSAGCETLPPEGKIGVTGEEDSPYPVILRMLSK